jgi:hypothetical protein
MKSGLMNNPTKRFRSDPTTSRNSSLAVFINPLYRFSDNASEGFDLILEVVAQ